MKIAVYPGSFDPVTNGHLDVIERASQLFDLVYVVVSDNIDKNYLFTAAERVQLVSMVSEHLDNVIVESSPCLTVDYAHSKKAKFIVRGLRAISDFEYELNIFATNKHLAPDLDTVFLMTKLENSFVSSSGVKEMIFYNAHADGLVDARVEKAIKEKYKQIKGD
ncbi:MAG: pantetheine-phosphate adenylyltransferase [Bacilli bacterium]|jgi:pantetheine-phosphate adenylyltransferase|nr:pantetheine-phosphate adenylyltransferase [Bacilli bacterium]